MQWRLHAPWSDSTSSAPCTRAKRERHYCNDKEYQYHYTVPYSMYGEEYKYIHRVTLSRRHEHNSKSTIPWRRTIFHVPRRVAEYNTIIPHHIPSTAKGTAPGWPFPAATVILEYYTIKPYHIPCTAKSSRVSCHHAVPYSVQGKSIAPGLHFPADTIVRVPHHFTVPYSMYGEITAPGGTAESTPAPKQASWHMQTDV